ncbi:interferon-inducible GTPase 1-like [Mya arenaria]|uniref:interferon-inducible GTPase 1-like n=1 Tax=Mya arenaria TaxID=6604 RepID=UPI0022DEE2A4|nr:interferon-inducible GTPase 1-like [Mya arenaria]
MTVKEHLQLSETVYPTESMTRCMCTTHVCDKQFLCMQEVTTQTDLNRQWRGVDGTTRYMCDMCGISINFKEKIDLKAYMDGPVARNHTSALNVGTVIGIQIEEHTEFMKESAKILKEKGYAALIEKFENESKHQNLVFYDVPDVGTESFPEKTYLQQIDIDNYDFFILTNSTRFTELDTWLAKEVISRQKKFYFVRTKVDFDIANNQKVNGKSKEYTFNHIREDCLNQLRKFVIKDPKVFLVNNHNTYDYDFVILSEILIKELPDLKREAMALSVSTTSEAVLKVNVQVLKK